MKSTDKPVRLFRYGRAAAGLILLVNPIISLYDILPDFIGYLLLFTALREVSRLEGRMEDAQSRLIWLAAFSGLRLTLALVFYDAQSSFKLLVCFSLAVVELVTFLMWSASFFSGLEYLLNRNDGEELVGRLSNVRFLTVLFFIVRSACNLLPEFTSLLEDAAMTDLTNAARYLALAGGKNLFILLGIVVVLVLGGFWLSGTLRFMKSAAGDARFSAALHRRYSEEGCDSPPRVRLRLLRSGFWAIIIGGGPTSFRRSAPRWASRRSRSSSRWRSASCSACYPYRASRRCAASGCPAACLRSLGPRRRSTGPILPPPATR